MDVQRRNQVPAAPGRSGLACHDLYGGAQGKVIAFLADGPPQEFLKKGSQGMKIQIKRAWIRKLVNHLNA